MKKHPCPADAAPFTPCAGCSNWTASTLCYADRNPQRRANLGQCDVAIYGAKGGGKRRTAPTAAASTPANDEGRSPVAPAIRLSLADMPYLFHDRSCAYCRHWTGRSTCKAGQDTLGTPPSCFAFSGKPGSENPVDGVDAMAQPGVSD